MAENILDRVRNSLPANAMISKLYFEGSEVIAYTKSRKFFVENEELIKKIVNKLKKRIEVRPDPEITLDTAEAERKIKEIVPEDAGITNLWFEEDYGKVLIEGQKPGLIIGKSGSTLQQIKSKIYWLPEVIRTPLIPSKIVSSVRKTNYESRKFKRKLLKSIGEKIHQTQKKKEEWIRLTSLGGFREVGRSCILLQTPNSNVLLDCGINVGSSDQIFPYLEAPEFDINDLDAVVCSHSHLDHSGFIPGLFKYGYKGPIYCTKPTRDLSTLIQLDYINVAQRESKKALYSSKEIEQMIKHTISLEYGEVTDITPDVRLTLFDAGHIAGSSIIHLHIGEGLHNIVYTSDIKYARSRLLNRAHTRFPRIETLLVESTYGGPDDTQPSRREAEAELINTIRETISRDGKVLMPVFSIGRSQEMCLVLEKWLSKERIKAPIYLDGMVWDATAIHTAYIEYLSRDLQNLIFRKGKNPFLSPKFKRVGSREERKKVMRGGPCIVLATSGMMVGGSSVEYLKAFAEDPKNTLIFVGYQAVGSLGRKIQQLPKREVREIPIGYVGGKIESLEVNMGIKTVEGFSGHSDRMELIKFVQNLSSRPERIIVNHGEKSKCLSLAYALHRLYGVNTEAPKNLETVRLV